MNAILGTFYYVPILFAISVLSNSEAEAGPMKILSIQECENPENNPVQYEINFEIGEDSIDIITGYFRILMDVEDDDTRVTVRGDKFVNDDWKKDVLVENIRLFWLINFAAGNIWTDFQQQVTPKMEKFDHIKFGKYTVEGFRANYADFTPIPLTGKYRWTVKVSLSALDDACVIVETDLD